MAAQPDGLDEQRARIYQASVTAQAALNSQQTAHQLRDLAAATGDSTEQERLLREAAQKKVEARSQGKTASWLQSGGVQGALGGASIGGALGTGLGTVTGAVVGGVSTLAVGELGAAIGLGVGALHGPFFDAAKSLGLAEDKEGAEKQQKMMEDAIQVNRRPTPPPDELQQIASTTAADEHSKSQLRNVNEPKPATSDRTRKKPRKLEVRSGKNQQQTLSS